MSGDAYEITTADLILETPEPSTVRSRSDISVTGVPTGDLTPAPIAPAARPRIEVSARARPIKERNRVRAEVEEGPTTHASKAAAFFEQALEAQRAGDAAGAIRHVKLAITFDPREPRYHALLSKLSR